MWSAWAYVACAVALDSTRMVIAVLGASVTVAAWTTVVALRGGWAWLGAAAVVAERAVISSADASAAFVSIGTGVWLARAMQAQRWLPARILAHWLSFAGTFAWVVPRAIVEQTSPAAEPRWALSLVATLLAFSITSAATVSFARAGGTPDPSDAPDILVTSGLYARLRHPIQIGHILFALAGLALAPQGWVALYSCTFICVLVGPARIVEERRLAARFGEHYQAWRSRVPAYIPRN